jgi:hypothetical protein
VLGDRKLGQEQYKQLKSHLYCDLLAKVVKVPPAVNAFSFASHISTMLGPNFFKGIQVKQEGCRILRPRKVWESPGDNPPLFYGFHASPEYDAQYLFNAEPYRIVLAKSPLQEFYPDTPYLDITPAPCARGNFCVGNSMLIPTYGAIHSREGRPFSGATLMAYADPSVRPDQHAEKAAGNFCLLCLRQAVYHLSVLRGSEDSRIIYDPNMQPILPFWNSSDQYKPSAMLHPTTRDVGIFRPVVNGLFQFLCWRVHPVRGPFVSQELIVVNQELYAPKGVTDVNPGLAPIFTDILNQAQWAVHPKSAFKNLVHTPPNKQAVANVSSSTDAPDPNEDPVASATSKKPKLETKK